MSPPHFHATDRVECPLRCRRARAARLARRFVARAPISGTKGYLPFLRTIRASFPSTSPPPFRNGSESRHTCHSHRFHPPRYNDFRCRTHHSVWSWTQSPAMASGSLQTLATPLRSKRPEEASDVSSMHINNTGCRDSQRNVDGRPHCARRKKASQDSTAGIRREIWSN